jgi:hypothetical protein
MMSRRNDPGRSYSEIARRADLSWIARSILDSPIYRGEQRVERRAMGRPASTRIQNRKEKAGVGSADAGKFAGGKPATGRLCQAGLQKKAAPGTRLT